MDPSVQTRIDPLMLLVIMTAVAFVAGGFIGWLVRTIKAKADLKDANHEYAMLKAHATEQYQSLEQRLALQTANEAQQKQEIQRIYQEQANQYRQLLDQTKAELGNYANTSMTESRAQLQNEAKSQMETLLTPLKERIQLFEKQVQENTVSHHSTKSALETHIKHLMEQTSAAQEVTSQLVYALRGDNKVLGDWGEIQLEGLLDWSGLEKDVHYQLQVSFDHPHAPEKRLRVDCMIFLPEGKRLFVDSKVSLKAYQDYMNTPAEQEENRREYLKAFLVAVKKQIDDLSGKQYHELGVSPEFTIMFMPIEPALLLLMHENPNLYKEAFDKRVILAGTSTLLPILQVVSSLWTMEARNQNAEKIAKEAGALYDKFANFVGDLENVRKSIGKAQDSVDNAFNKLKEGKGNLLSRVQNLPKLGARTNPDKAAFLTEQALSNEDAEDPSKDTNDGEEEHLLAIK